MQTRRAVTCRTGSNGERGDIGGMTGMAGRSGTGSIFYLAKGIMRTTEKIRDNALVIFPEGHLDIHAVMVFEKLVNMGMEDNPGCHLLVDLSDTAYVSSSCMRLFVEIHARLARKGLKIVLYNPNAITRKVLDLTEITRYIRVCETREQALASLELNQPL